MLSRLLIVEPPPLNEALSGVFGSISLVAWICLLLPQLITNYKAQSADALSMGFLFIWLAGDVSNLTGAILTNLSPTAMVLGSYFVVADAVLISQCLYYNTKNKIKRDRKEARRTRASSQPSEESPLLNEERPTSPVLLPSSHIRHAVHEESTLEPLRKVLTGEDETPDRNPWLHNTLSVLAVWTVGILGWAVSYRYGMWDSVPEVEPPTTPQGQVLHAWGTGLGFLSALFYLCARVPQIIKNWRDKSCEGLALLFFLLSLTGNMTYGLSLVAYSQDKADLIKAIPWLMGSLGTMVEDCIIFVQFRLYSPRRQE